MTGNGIIWEVVDLISDWEWSYWRGWSYLGGGLILRHLQSGHFLLRLDCNVELLCGLKLHLPHPSESFPKL